MIISVHQHQWITQYTDVNSNDTNDNNNEIHNYNTGTHDIQYRRTSSTIMIMLLMLYNDIRHLGLLNSVYTTVILSNLYQTRQSTKCQFRQMFSRLGAKDPVQYSIVQYSIVQVQVQHSIVLYTIVYCIAYCTVLLYYSIQYTIQYNVYCSIVQYRVVYYSNSNSNSNSNRIVHRTPNRAVPKTCSPWR